MIKKYRIKRFCGKIVYIPKFNLVVGIRMQAISRVTKNYDIN